MSLKKFAIVFALLLAFFTASASAGCFDSMLEGTVPSDKNLMFDIAWQSDAGNTFGSIEAGYIVPAGSVMSIQNIGTYTVHCEDGANVESKPPLRLKITWSPEISDIPVLLQEEPNSIIYLPASCEGLGNWCNARPNCPVCDGGPICKSLDPVEAFTFQKEGVYRVVIEFAAWAAKKEVIPASDWRAAKDFNVFVFTPLLSINSSRTQLLPIKQGQTTEAAIVWTLQNLSAMGLKIKDITALACRDNNLQCTFFPDPKGLSIKPNTFKVIVQSVKLVNPPADYAARDVQMKLQAVFSDAQGIMEFKKTSLPTLLKIKPLGQQKISVRIKAPGPDICYGSEGTGRTGLTGNSAVPKLKLPFSWAWNEISINECDKNLSTSLQDYHYCDAMQFSIEVLKKLQRVDSINQSINITGSEAAELMHLQNFSTYLMKDGFSQDFMQDLTDYLSNEAFAEVPSWFKPSGGKFSQLFSDSNKFKLSLAVDEQHLNQALQLNSPNTQDSSLPGPGLYEVRISANYADESKKSFILSGVPNAIINVYFIKKSSPVQDSVFYYIPIDGPLGFDEQSGAYNRQGYGTTASQGELKVIMQGTQAVMMPRNYAGSTALNTAAITDINDFYYINQDSRGSVLTLANSSGNVSITKSPSNATPVLLRVKQGEFNNNASIPTSNASAFYYIKEGASAPSPGTIVAQKDFLAYWNAVASNMRSAGNSCKDFSMQNMFSNRKDMKMQSAGTSCNFAESAVNSGNAFGFSWNNLPKESDSNFLYLQSVIYAPKGKDFKIFNACTDRDFKIITPTGNKEISRGASGTSGFLPLNYDSGTATETLQNLLDAVKNKKLCLTTNSQTADFWWNEKELLKEFQNSLSANSEFKLNHC